VHRVDRARQREAPREPLRHRFAKFVEPLVAGIAAELVDMGGHHWANERGHPMLRLAHRQADWRLARQGVAQKLAQPHERRTADGGPGGRGRIDALGGGHEHRLSGARPPHNGFLTIGAARLRAV
jgi:hypothetical protein